MKDCGNLNPVFDTKQGINGAGLSRFTDEDRIQKSKQLCAVGFSFNERERERVNGLALVLVV